jgi:hypothetical protein
MTMTDVPRTEYGSVEQQITVLSPLECQQIVDDIVESVKNPNSPGFNPSLAAELQIWTELKNRQSDAHANAIVDMVRAGDKPLHRFFPASVQIFLGKLDMLTRQRHDGGGQRGQYGQLGQTGQVGQTGQGGQGIGTTRYR